MNTEAESKLAERFRFLDDLRESGITNMYGAAPFVQGEFSISYDAACKTLQAWMQTFSHDKSPEARAAEHLKTEAA